MYKPSRACDACHRRKVKCHGINLRRNCSSAQLSCTYNAILQKKGPKGLRAKVISELRETQRQTSLFAKVQNRMNGIICPPAQGLAPNLGLLTTKIVKECIQFFFDNLYPRAPILDMRVVKQQLLYMEQDRDSYCLMTSLCAFVMLQPGTAMPPGDPYNLDMAPGANIVSSQLLVEETLRVRKGHKYLDAITLNVLATNFFLFACCYGQEMHDRAWYYIREATTMIQLIGMNKEEHLMQFDAAEAARRRRLYWLYFATERAYALQRGRPVTLQATINPPTLSDDLTDPLAHQLNGFLLLVDLYRPLDDAFTAAWNKTRGHLSLQYISGLQKQLQDLAQSYICQDSNFTDLLTNQQWLKNTTWQLASTGNGDGPMGSQYPLNLARELSVNLASQFPGSGMELINSSLIEKLIETAYTMSEYLSIQPASRDPFAIGPREHFDQITSIAAMSRNGDNHFLPLLFHKVSDVLPRLISPMLQNAPENTPMANMDMFDGFGTYSVEGYEKKYTMEMYANTSPESGANSNNSPPASPQHAADLDTSFVNSPAIMSPVMDYPHSMNSFAMNDMVMSPIGNPGQSSTMGPSQQMGHNHDVLAVQHHMNNMRNSGVTPRRFP
ncbi:hypothetical protein S40293_09394 [Stachybotrys chartarum IBT 40293]|nr:hypothetical protein S40293_09394 [Stachybotrys chartarum IBT 40293]